MQLNLSKGKLSKGKSPYLPFSNVTKIFDHHTHGTAFLCVCIEAHTYIQCRAYWRNPVKGLSDSWNGITKKRRV